MGNLSRFEIDNCAIILSGFDQEMIIDIMDNESEEEYGIIDVFYEEDADDHIVYFSEERWDEMMKEYEFNHQDEK